MSYSFSNLLRISKSVLLSEKIIIRTSQYAKRQLKWFDAQQFDIVLDADNINSDDMVDKIAQIC